MTYPNTVISMPSQLFTMRGSFKAVANGSVYIGEVDTDPTIPTNQIQVYIEQENGTLVPVAQPIKINSAGLLTASGQVQKFVLTNTEYSMTVQNSYGVDEFYFPRVYDQGISAALEVEERLLGPGAKIYRGSNGQYIQNGNVIPSENQPYTHIAVPINGKIEDVAISPIASGVVSGLTDTSATIGTTQVGFLSPYLLEIGATAPDEIDTLLSSDVKLIQIGSEVSHSFGTRKGIQGNGNTIKGTVSLGIPPVDDWDYIKHRDTTFDANGSGDSVTFGNSVEGGVIRINGRHSFDNCRFTNGSKGVNKPQGNIGNQFSVCSFDKLDFGYYAQDSDTGTMHAGADTLDVCHFRNINKAAIFIDDQTDGSGGYDFRSLIVENSECFAVFGIGPSGRNRIPFSKNVIDGLWVEMNLISSAQIDINGTLYDPYVIRLEDYNDWDIKNSYIYDIQLVNSKITLHNCRLGSSFLGTSRYDLDSTSMMTIYDLMLDPDGADFNTRMLVNSIKRCSGADKNRSYSFRMPNPESYSYIDATKLSIKFDTQEQLQGTGTVNGTVVNEGIISGTCNEFTIPAGYTELTQSFDLGAVGGKYVVWSVSVKLVSGSGAFDLTNTFTLGKVLVNAGEWVTTRGYQYVTPGDTGNARLYITETSGINPLIFRVCDLSIVAFDTEIEAIEYVNSGRVII